MNYTCSKCDPSGAVMCRLEFRGGGTPRTCPFPLKKRNHGARVKAKWEDVDTVDYEVESLIIRQGDEFYEEE